MTRRKAGWLRWMTGIACACTAMLQASTAGAQGLVGYVLTTTNVLHTIDVENPGTSLASVTITGVAAGETLVGIDIRPVNGGLYALGVNATTDTMTLYHIAPQTGFAAVVGTGGFTSGGNLPDPAVARYGVDFNPTVDRLRITTNQSGAGPAVPGLNFRVNPNTGALVQADTDINPAPISIDEIAYTNNGISATVTTLYTISSAQNALYIQSPANSGTQTAFIALSQPVTAVLGFDLDPLTVVAASNAPVTPTSHLAYAVVTTASGTGLAHINLLSGAVGSIAPIAGGITNIRGLAVSTSISGELPVITLVNNGTDLRRFTTAAPGMTVTAAINPAGIVAGDQLKAIDFRPQTGQLYALGHNSVANTVQVYLVDPWANAAGTTASVTAIGPPVALTDAGPSAFGFDFNPTVDRIRVVTNVGENFRLNPNNGTLAGTDTDINPAGSVVTGAAYTNNFGQPLIGGTTTMYTIDATNDRLAIQAGGSGSPNNGTQTELHPITLGGSPLDFSGINGFDIPSSVRTGALSTPATGKAYAALFVGGLEKLYAIELSDGTATDLGNIGNGLADMVGLTVGEVPPILTHTTVITPTAHVGLGETVTLIATVEPAGVTGSVTFFANGSNIGTVPLSAAGQATLNVSNLAVGDYQITASYSGSGAHTTSTTAQPLALVVGNFRQHFAEGATGFFQTSIGVLNASATKVANVTLKLFPEGAATITQTFTLQPLKRQSIDVNAIMAAASLAGGVSTLIEADQPIAATRQMTWGAPQIWGSSLESGVPDTGTTWFFAEGATGVFSLYFLIENPQSTQANVTFTHLLEGGAAPIVRNVSVAPASRKTFYINEVPGAEAASLSTIISSSVPIVAERAMYINTTSRQWEGGTASAGSRALSTNWSLAEGATGFFFTYLLLGNPNMTDASVTVRYQLPDGTTIDKMYTVTGQSRRTIDVRGEDPQLASTSVGMTITSSIPIVAERAMWWGLPFYEGSVAFGSTQTGSLWAIGEGIEGQAANEATFVLVSNSSATAGTVRFTVVYNDGTSEQQDVPLPGSARQTVRIGTSFPNSQNKAFSVVVESLTGGVPITVEYSRYQSPAGFLDAGGAALATRVR